MFTGIIEEIGRMRVVNSGEKSARMTLEARTVLEGVALGDSIAVNGVCLTVVSYDAGSFTVDVSPESLRSTTLGELRPGDRVNLERALQAGGRFGGHMVSGHIDGVGRVRSMRQEGNATVIDFSAPPEILELSVPKGSIAVDGISLTINALDASSFSVSIIPHTGEWTTLLNRRVGDRVNLESDMIGKYVYRFLNRQNQEQGESKTELSMGFLSEHGFA